MELEAKTAELVISAREGDTNDQEIFDFDSPQILEWRCGGRCGEHCRPVNR